MMICRADAALREIRRHLLRTPAAVAEDKRLPAFGQTAIHFFLEQLRFFFCILEPYEPLLQRYLPPLGLVILPVQPFGKLFGVRHCCREGDKPHKRIQPEKPCQAALHPCAATILPEQMELVDYNKAYIR